MATTRGKRQMLSRLIAIAKTIQLPKGPAFRSTCDETPSASTLARQVNISYVRVCAHVCACVRVCVYIFGKQTGKLYSY